MLSHAVPVCHSSLADDFPLCVVYAGDRENPPRPPDRSLPNPREPRQADGGK